MSKRFVLLKALGRMAGPAVRAVAEQRQAPKSRRRRKRGGCSPCEAHGRVEKHAERVRSFRGE